MKKYILFPKLYLRGAVFVLLCLFCGPSAIAQVPTVTQSHCFTVTLDTTSHTCSGDCIDNNCATTCIAVKICSDKCPGLNPTSFTISTDADQHANCRCYPALVGCVNDPGDKGPSCSWQGSRKLDVTAIGGLADGNCITFFMCEGVAGLTHYTITCDKSCGSTSCDAATFTW